MPPTLRVVLDVLKPHEPGVPTYAEQVADLDGVAGVNADLLETDREVQNVKLTVEGADVDVPAVEAAVEALGGTVHSVDQVICGDRLVETVQTPQDGG